ncbi:MAG: NAD(+)/NADH kinase [Peptoniphilaceae bacterium]|nr:NAD(+)/NADH kinase [Peptoniphilaceae bacterium]
MKKVVNLFVKPNARSIKNKDRTEQFFLNKGYAISRYYNEEAQCNIVMGGDGSFLRAVHMTDFSPIPFLGINTGRVGFFQEIDLTNMEYYLNQYIEGNFRLDRLSLISADVETTSWTYRLLAVNELLIRPSDQKLLVLDLSIDNHPFIRTSGDGLMASTPSGSTAHNLSAGGSILHQSLNGYQLTMMSPIRSKSYDALPASVVVPSTTQAALRFDEADMDRIEIQYDGVRRRIFGIKRILIHEPEQLIHRISFEPNWYWRNLREKLF